MLLMISLSGVAQKKTSAHVNVKKEIAAARACIKRGKDLESAEKSMRNLLKDTANIGNEKIWLTLFETVKKQYEQLNEQLYLKQQSDTAQAVYPYTPHVQCVREYGFN